jgi:hypothetical protein
VHNDKELLEAAARAVGNIEWDYLEGCFYVNDDITNPEWNPLEDDGDAFRLRAKLCLEIYDGDDEGPTVFVRALRRNQAPLFIQEMRGSDACAATRRAIVRAAAEMGKQSTEKSTKLCK